MGDEALQLSDLQEDEVFILGELIGGYQLTLEEHVQGLKDKHMKPYCMVKFQNKAVHYSSACNESGRDPIWTVSTGSLFLLKVSPSTLPHDNLQISIWTKKNATSLQGTVFLDVDNYFLGKATVDGQTLLSKCNEERLELTLEDLHGTEIGGDSSLAVRFRLATDSDIRLINLLREEGISPPKLLSDTSFRTSQKRLKKNPVKDLILGEGNQLPIAAIMTEDDETKIAGDFFMDTLSSAFRPSTKCDRETGLRKVRIKPGPDPSRLEETTYMSPFALKKETREPSRRWVEAGSGQIGTLHLEILSCHDLPNVDVGEAVGNLSDCFVTAVFEDVMLQTPVIDDELSPHWMPWMQRAFRIGIVHPGSILSLAVFDYDFASDHDPLGRIAINLTNFQSNTMYTLTYKLHPTSDLAERAPNGTITIRLRIEYKDEKAAIMAALQPRPVFHVNTRTAKTFKVLRYTCFGEYDNEEKFAWAVTRSYISEILEYWRGLKFYIGQCLWSLVYWRGQVTIFSMNLPVHSAVLFISGTILIERPWLILPFYCLFAAWFMLACMAHRRETPSPWHTCTSFLQFAEIALTGKSSIYRERLRPGEFAKQHEEYEKAFENWKERYQSSVDKSAAMEERLTAIGDENISTTVTGQMMPLDLFEKLGRYQAMIGRFCTKFRRIKSIIIWEDSMASFWITAKCLIVGLVSLILPWRTLLYLVGKIIVWGFLGPHMKLVDLYLQSKRAQQEESELEKFRAQTRLARIRREEAIKLKDMKCLAFGEFVALVPSENLPRHYDHPLHESFARYVSPSATQQQVPSMSRIPGQQLYGLMIPNSQSGLAHQQEEQRIREMKLSLLTEQVTRLQSIEQHLSSRPTNAGLDEDLPDDLGYEVTLCDDILTCQEESKHQENETLKDTDITVSLSPSGFRECNSKEEQCIVSYSPSKSQGLAHTFSLLAQERLPIEGETNKQEEHGNASGDDEQSCDQFDAPSGDQPESVALAAEDSSKVDQHAGCLASLVASPNSREQKNGKGLKRQSFVEAGIEVGPSDDSYMTPLVEHSDSAQERSSVAFPSQENSADLADRDLDGDIPVGKSDSIMTWSLGSPEEEKKDQEDPEALAEDTFMTPEREEEAKKEAVASAIAFLELNLTDGCQNSAKDETPKPSNRHLLGPRQKSAAVSVRSIGSGSMSCLEDQPPKPNNPDESIQVTSIGAGSLRAGSDEELVIEDCKAPQMKNMVVTALAVAGPDEPAVPTPRCRPGRGTSSTFEDCIEREASRCPSPPAHGDTKATESVPAASTADDWFEAIKTTSEESAVPSTAVTQHRVAAEAEGMAQCVPFRNPNLSISTTETDITTMTNNTSIFRLPTCSQSLKNDDTKDPMKVRKTWSSGSLQQEKTWIKQNPTDSVFELSSRRSLVVKEEGLEIVAMGRLRTIGDELAEGGEDEEDENATICSSDTAVENDSSAAETESPVHRGLSVAYESNSFVQVATYRP